MLHRVDVSLSVLEFTTLHQSVLPHFAVPHVASSLFVFFPVCSSPLPHRPPDHAPLWTRTRPTTRGGTCFCFCLTRRCAPCLPLSPPPTSGPAALRLTVRGTCRNVTVLDIATASPLQHNHRHIVIFAHGKVRRTLLLPMPCLACTVPFHCLSYCLRLPFSCLHVWYALRRFQSGAVVDS
jgi:hypothetical protein